MVASQNGHSEVVQQLLVVGANSGAADKVGLVAKDCRSEPPKSPNAGLKDVLFACLLTRISKEGSIKRGGN